jgi:hypothetical protein
LVVVLELRATKDRDRAFGGNSVFSGGFLIFWPKTSPLSLKNQKGHIFVQKKNRPTNKKRPSGEFNPVLF